MGGHEIDGPEPRQQRQLRTMHDRAGRHRGLLAASGAFEGEGLSAMRPTLGAGACGTSKPGGPARCAKPGGAGVVVGKLVLEFDQRGGKVGHGGTFERIECSRYVPTRTARLCHYPSSPRSLGDKPLHAIHFIDMKSFNY